MYTFTNHFSKSDLKSRIGMINQQRSTWWRVGWRYGFLGLIGLLGFLACKKTESKEAPYLSKHQLPAINPTRGLVVELEQSAYWVRTLSFYSTRHFQDKLSKGDPLVIGLKGDRLLALPKHLYDTRYFVNGKEVSPEALAQIAFSQVTELFVMQQLEANGPDPDDYVSDPKPYRLLIETTDKAVPATPKRDRLADLLTASTISEYPFGESFMFTMNSLLEAMFFHNKKPLVQRTKNDYLQVLDEFKSDITVFINDIEVNTKEVETVHVREIARLYTQERPYQAWLRPDPARQTRFVLYIQTEPKRAKRDSSYYVFSPFYQGDF